MSELLKEVFGIVEDADKAAAGVVKDGKKIAKDVIEDVIEDVHDFFYYLWD